MAIQQEIPKHDDMEVEESKHPSVSHFGQKSPGSLSNYDFDSIKGMFDKTNMIINYRKLNEEYGKELNEDQLDERFFLQSNVKTNSITVTPFIRQGHANKPLDQKAIKKEVDTEQIATKQLNSKRLLDYNASSSTSSKMLSLSSKLKDIKFPNLVQSSPYSIKAFTPATPISLSLEMVHWLKYKCENSRRSLNKEGFPPVMSKHLEYCKEETKTKIMQSLNSWVSKIDSEYKNDYNRSVVGKSSNDNVRYLYLKLVDELLLQEENSALNKQKQPISEKVIKELSRTLYRIEFHKAVFT